MTEFTESASSIVILPPHVFEDVSPFPTPTIESKSGYYKDAQCFVGTKIWLKRAGEESPLRILFPSSIVHFYSHMRCLLLHTGRFSLI